MASARFGCARTDRMGAETLAVVLVGEPHWSCSPGPGLLDAMSYTESLYVVLGVEEDASQQEIKQAYKKA